MEDQVEEANLSWLVMRLMGKLGQIVHFMTRRNDVYHFGLTVAITCNRKVSSVFAFRAQFASCVSVLSKNRKHKTQNKTSMFVGQKQKT